ncbi:MAG: cob(I)yrinic acid a,c-diamide adenosyltransferase [Hyphomonadaceae bacterium]|nr:cob(I)yrinic acid a,c-diamide adenosyltransferase [Hyphomonadaceae bacterium]
MVKLDKIYTRAGDGGRTRLATGEEVAKFNVRVEAYGAVDETNAVLGVARLYAGTEPALDAMLSRIQNELFDLGADLATPERDQPLPFEALRILPSQVTHLEQDIDALNADLSPLTSFILPAGAALSTHLHVARATARRAERAIAALMDDPAERVSPEALRYANRLSDFLFVAARWANRAAGDVLWVPGATR